MKKIITLLLTAIMAVGCGNNAQKGAEPQDKPWQEIKPTEIELNPLQMIDRDWLELSAGKEGNMNLMTISWGSIGELWGKPLRYLQNDSRRGRNRAFLWSDRWHFYLLL